jgi:hypothetical protein
LQVRRKTKRRKKLNPVHFFIGRSLPVFLRVLLVSPPR